MRLCDDQIRDETYHVRGCQFAAVPLEALPPDCHGESSMDLQPQRLTRQGWSPAGLESIYLPEVEMESLYCKELCSRITHLLFVYERE